MNLKQTFGKSFFKPFKKKHFNYNLQKTQGHPVRQESLLISKFHMCLKNQAGTFHTPTPPTPHNCGNNMHKKFK